MMNVLIAQKKVFIYEAFNMKWIYLICHFSLLKTTAQMQKFSHFYNNLNFISYLSIILMDSFIRGPRYNEEPEGYNFFIFWKALFAMQKVFIRLMRQNITIIIDSKQWSLYFILFIFTDYYYYEIWRLLLRSFNCVITLTLMSRFTIHIVIII